MYQRYGTISHSPNTDKYIDGNQYHIFLDTKDIISWALF